MNQGGRSCTGARVADAKKFGLGQKFYARTYAILSRIKICRDLRTFWRSLGKKSAFLGQKQCFLGKKCTISNYMVCIAYFTELILQTCDYAQKDAFEAKIVNTRLTKIFMAIFALAERLPTSATLDPNQGIHKPLLSNNFLDTFGNANFLDNPLN